LVKKLVLLSLVLLLCLSVAAWSQDGQGRQRWQQRQGAPGPACVCAILMVPPPEMIENAAARLGLTDEQKKQLTAVLQAAMPKMEPLRVQAAKSMAALRLALFSDKDLAAALDAANKAEAAVAAAELEVWLKIRPILGAEGLKQLGEAMGRTGRRGPGPGGPEGPPMAPPPPGAPPPLPPPGE
jgi:Spy/CpxP family protein refolding chaperone